MRDKRYAAFIIGEGKKHKDICEGDIFMDMKPAGGLPRKKLLVANAHLGDIPDFDKYYMYVVETNPEPARKRIQAGEIYVSKYYDEPEVLTAKYDTQHELFYRVVATNNRSEQYQQFPNITTEFIRAFIADEGWDRHHRIRSNDELIDVFGEKYLNLYLISEDGKIANEIPLGWVKDCILGIDLKPEPEIDLKNPPINELIEFFASGKIDPTRKYYECFKFGFNLGLKQKEIAVSDAIEFMVWTYYPNDCPFEMNDEDDWINTITGDHVDTDGLYQAFLTYKKNKNDQGE